MTSVGFLVLAYNYGRFLPECLDSLLAQTYSDWEAWILDDASTDDTPEVARKYTDTRIHYIRHPKNLGLTGNFNDGLARSRSRYLWVISADDALHDPAALERAVAALESDPAVGLVWSGAERLNGERERLAYFDWGPGDRLLPPPQLAEALVESNRICAPGALARRTLYDAAGPAPDCLVYSLDWYYWFRFGLAAAARYLAAPLSRYRIHEQNMTHANGRQPLHVQFREHLILRLWIERDAARFPALVRRAGECVQAELRQLFKHWTDEDVPAAEAGPFVRRVAEGVAAMPGESAASLERVRAAVQAATRAELREYRRRRRPRAWWRGWKLRRALLRSLR